MSHTNNRSNAAHESNNPVNNLQHGNKPAPAPETDAPVPAQHDELEQRLTQYTNDLKDAKKKSQKASENLAKVRDMASNQRYVVAVSRVSMGIATEEDLLIIASRKVSDNVETALAKAMGIMPKDAEDVAKARADAQSEEGTLTQAIAETIRCWNKHYATLYRTIGITNKKSVTPALLRDMHPYLVVATADGLKAATVTRTAVRKNGKAVKQDGKRVYRYALREKTRWTAYSLFEMLERNYVWTSSEVFTADELQVRKDLLAAETDALKALKAAKDAAKSDIPEEAHDAQNAEQRLKDAANAAGQATKEQLKGTSMAS